MNNVNDFLAKLENVQWTEDTRRDKEIRGVLLGKDVRVTLDVRIDSVKCRIVPFNLTMRIYIDDTLASMWGCMDLEEQMIMTEWFVNKGVEASNNEYEARQKKESEARAFFKMM